MIDSTGRKVNSAYIYILNCRPPFGKYYRLGGLSCNAHNPKSSNLHQQSWEVMLWKKTTVSDPAIYEHHG